jgi:hypothetical protein
VQARRLPSDIVRIMPQYRDYDYTVADSARCRPPFRNDLAHRSDLMSPTIPR